MLCSGGIAYDRSYVIAITNPTDTGHYIFPEPYAKILSGLGGRTSDDEKRTESVYCTAGSYQPLRT